MRRPVSPALDQSGLVHALGLAAGLAVAFAVGYVLVRPLSDSPVGYDTAGSVLYFQRIIRGQLLEQPYGATPKPLMTVIDGLLYAVGGWKAISAAAVLVCALVVTFGAELVRRIAGLPAAAFAFTLLLGSQALVLDEALAYAVGWASLWLLAAAFALRARRPRYGIAGLALAAATLTRLEVLVVVIGAVGAVAAWQWLVPLLAAQRPGRLGIAPTPRAAWLVSLGLLAVPVMLLHDWLLIRNPMYWASVSAAYSAILPDSVRSPVAVADWMARHYASTPLLIALAVLGALLILRRRERAVGIGLTLVGPGIAVLLLLIAARHTYVSGRYVYLMDLAVAIAASIGFGALRAPDLAQWLPTRPRVLTAVTVALAVVVAYSAAKPFAPLDASTRATVAIQRQVARNLRAAEPSLRRAIDADGPLAQAPRMLAPGLWTPQLIVDFALTIPDVGVPAFNTAGTDYAAPLHVGELIYHDRAGDPKNAVAATLEAGGQVQLSGQRLALLASDPTAGWWLYRAVANP